MDHSVHSCLMKKYYSMKPKNRNKFEAVKLKRAQFISEEDYLNHLLVKVTEEIIPDSTSELPLVLTILQVAFWQTQDLSNLAQALGDCRNGKIILTDR